MGQTLENGLLISMGTFTAHAECGKKTRYVVNYGYKEAVKSDVDLNCTESEKIDGSCFSSTYADDVVFSIKEFTDGTYQQEADNSTMQTIAGKKIYLSMRTEENYPGYKFAINKCLIVDLDGQQFDLINPASIENPTCEYNSLSFQGSYDDQLNFNFEHVLFILGSQQDQDENRFFLECTKSFKLFD